MEATIRRHKMANKTHTTNHLLVYELKLKDAVQFAGFAHEDLNRARKYMLMGEIRRANEAVCSARTNLALVESTKSIYNDLDLIVDDIESIMEKGEEL